MALVSFTPHLARHLSVDSVERPGDSVRAVLEAVFADQRELRGYVLDDQGALRKHVVVFVDGQAVRDREQLSDAVGPRSELYVMQALSGG